VANDDLGEVWAVSTLASPYGDLVKVFETPGKERIWLHDIFDDNEIPYLIEIKPTFRSFAKSSKFNETQLIFVRNEDEETALTLISEFESAEAVDMEEEAEGDGFDKQTPQIECPYCGAMIDFDYPKCPFCRKTL